MVVVVVVGEGRLPKRVRLDSASMGMTLMAHPADKSKPSAVGRLSSKPQFYNDDGAKVQRCTVWPELHLPR